MPIVPSRSREIQERLAELGSASAATRDSAAARLTLLGERSVAPLIESLRRSSPLARLGAIKVLGRLRAPRALPALLEQLGDREGRLVAAAAGAIATLGGASAVAALSRVLSHGEAEARAGAARALAKLFVGGVEEALEPLVTTLLDAKADEPLRRTADKALSRLPPRELHAIRARLAEAADEIARNGRAGGADAAARRRFPGTPDIDALLASPPRGAAAVPALHRALSGLKDAEAASRLHRALAERGSRIALYDLRERLEARPARAAEALLEIAGRIGDASLLAAIVALAVDRTALTGPCADALAAIVSRERLRKTQRLVKTVRPEHRKVLDGLWARAMRRAGPAR